MKINAGDLFVLRPMALISTLSGLAAWGGGEDPWVWALVGFLAMPAIVFSLLLIAKL